MSTNTKILPSSLDAPNHENSTEMLPLTGKGADQLAAEYDKRKERISSGGRTAHLPCEGDLVFVRRTPDAVQRITDGKKSQDDDSVSKRLLYFADPKLYRVSRVIPLGGPSNWCGSSRI